MIWIVQAYWASSQGLRQIRAEIAAHVAGEAIKVFELLKTPNEVGYFAEFKVIRKMP